MSEKQLTEGPSNRTGLWVRRALVAGVAVTIVGGTVVGLGAMSAAAPKPDEKAETVEALPVLTAFAEPGDVNLKVYSQGEVIARSQVHLAAEVSGRISYVAPKFLPGGTFRKGDVLFRVNSREYELRVTQAEANVAQAQTNLKREQSEAQIAKQNAAELGLSNVSDLALREPQVAEAQARLAAAQAALAEARLNLSKTEVRAPFSGRVKDKAVDLGAFVGPGTALGEVFSSDVVEVPLALTDADLAKINVPIGFEADSKNSGPLVTLTADVAGQGHSWTGHITRLDAGFDPDTRVLFGYVTVNDPYGAGADNGMPLATGLFVSAQVEGEAIEGAILIPRTALRGTDRVFVVDNENRLRIRDVVVASSDREMAVITDGLQAGERVISSPVRAAADGMMVSPVDQAARNGGAVLAAAASTSREE